MMGHWDPKHVGASVCNFVTLIKLCISIVSNCSNLSVMNELENVNFVNMSLTLSNRTRFIRYKTTDAPFCIPWSSEFKKFRGLINEMLYFEYFYVKKELFSDSPVMVRSRKWNSHVRKGHGSWSVGNCKPMARTSFFVFSTNFSSIIFSLSCILLPHTDIAVFLGWYYYRQRNNWDTPAVLSMLSDNMYTNWIIRLLLTWWK